MASVFENYEKRYRNVMYYYYYYVIKAVWIKYKTKIYILTNRSMLNIATLKVIH